MWWHDRLTVGCNNETGNGKTGTQCAGHQTLIEQKSQFALWCMLASPLILGNDIRYMSDEIFKIITNADLIGADALSLRLFVIIYLSIRPLLQCCTLCLVFSYIYIYYITGTKCA